MNNVSIEKTGDQIAVKSMYHLGFIEQARKMGGKWKKEESAWLFDARDERHVRDLCLRIYATDGDTVPDTVTLRIEWRKTEFGAGKDGYDISVAGRVIVDSIAAKKGPGVVVLAGDIVSGLVRKTPESRLEYTSYASPGTVVLIHDFPRTMAQHLIEQQTDDDARIYAIIDDAPTDDTRRAELDWLRERIAALQRRADEVEAQLLAPTDSDDAHPLAV